MFRLFNSFWLIVPIYYSFRLWSLVVYNPSDAHFDLSEVMFYLYLHTTLILQTITSYCVPPTFVRASYHFNLTSTSFPFCPRPYPSHIDLGYASFYCAPSIIRCFSSHFVISLRSRSIFRYIHRTSYTEPHIRLLFIIRSFSDRILTLYHSLFWRHRNC